MNETDPATACNQATRQTHLGMLGSATAGPNVCIVESLRASTINPNVVPRIGERCTEQCLMADINPMPPLE